MDPRSGPERKADTMTLLKLRHADAWVATASPDGVPHLVPLSYAWDGHRIVVATRPRNPTALNLAATGRARVALGLTRDVAMFDTMLHQMVAVKEAEDLAEVFAAQGDWDPRESTGEWVFLALRPTAVQAWREENELAGRDIMRAGEWLY